MQLPLLVLLPLAAANPLFFPDYLPSTPSFEIPTSRESAVMARRILHLSPLGTLATVFPSEKPRTGAEASKDDQQSLGDYYADCEPTGNPTLLAVNVDVNFKNAAAGSNVSLSVAWRPPTPPKSSSHTPFSLWPFSSQSPNDPQPLPYSPASLPRFALLGHLELISPADVDALKLAKCFTDKYPDAKRWLPGNTIHQSDFARLVVEKVYWVGGFGNRAMIGYLPLQEWRSVERSEWENKRLPGEKEEKSGWLELLSKSAEFI